MPSRADIERILVGIWSDLLMIDVSVDEDFFDAGGYSLLIVDLVSQARAAGISMVARDIYEHRTIERLAAALAAPGSAEPLRSRVADVGGLWSNSMNPWSPDAPLTIVPLRETGSGEPVFFVHWGIGSVDFLGKVDGTFGAGRPVYGIEAAGYRHPVRPLLSITEMAEYYLWQVRKIQPHGPYHLGGACQGALIALEMARKLRAQGEQTPVLALVNLPDLEPFLDPGWGLDEIVAYRMESLRATYDIEDIEVDLPRVLPEFGTLGWYHEAVAADFLRYQLIWSSGAFAQEHYHPRPYDGPALLFHVTGDDDAIRARWDDLLPNRRVHTVDCAGHTLPVLRSAEFTDVMARELG
jgi:thioesterase domain-containing protein